MRSLLVMIVMSFLAGHAAAQGLGDLDAFKKLEEYRRQLHTWDRMVRGFRREHSFGLTSGAAYGSWQLREVNQTAQELETEAYYSEFQYTFHIPIAGSFGYFLGSSVGAVFDEESEKSTFKPSRSVALPGLLAGFVLNFTPALRFSLGLNGHLERLERMPVVDALQNPTNISVNTRVLAGQAALEVFWRLRWAVRFEAAYRQLFYLEPNNLAADSPLTTDIHKNETRFGMGLVYHLI